MAETYRIKLYAGGPYIGCNSEEIVSLAEYGYSDEEWDALPRRKKSDLLYEWGEEYFWNEGYEFNADVEK